MWRVQATLTRCFSNGSVQSTQVATFDLDENVHGILSIEGALRIAKSIVDPFSVYSVSAYVQRIR